MHYRALSPEITRFFARRELFEVLDRLLEASQQPTIYEIADYHWLVVHACLEASCSRRPSWCTVYHREGAAPHVKRRARELYARHLDIVRMAHDAGVKVVAGTDAGGHGHPANARAPECLG